MVGVVHNPHYHLEYTSFFIPLSAVTTMPTIEGAAKVKAMRVLLERTLRVETIMYSSSLSVDSPFHSAVGTTANKYAVW